MRNQMSHLLPCDRGSIARVRSALPRAIVFLFVMVSVLHLPEARADVAAPNFYFFDTDALVVRDQNGNVVTSINGTPVTATLQPGTGIAAFLFAGDLTLLANDNVIGTGSRPAVFSVGP